MVHLSMTPAMVAALRYQQSMLTHDSSSPGHPSKDTPTPDSPHDNPLPGNAITHQQLIDLSRSLATVPSTASSQPPPHTLDVLLRGATLYRPAPVSRPLPRHTPSYEALMARLRHDADARSYAQLTSSSSATGATTAVTNTHVTAFSAGDTAAAAPQADELTYADASRQATLIFNVLVSVLACGVAVWLGAWHWAAPARLALSMVGAVVVGAAEVAVYWGYLRRIGEAKAKERGKREEKSVVASWVIEGKGKRLEETAAHVHIRNGEHSGSTGMERGGGVSRNRKM